MAIKRYLAMTAAELRSSESLPPHTAWMACHFSPYSTGLSNLPTELPPDSLLILNDRIPLHGHDPDRMADQLSKCVQQLSCGAVLLDFQRHSVPEYFRLAELLDKSLPCPMAVSPCCAQGLTCPVFLPPAAHHVPLEKHLAPWKERQIWLDIAMNTQRMRISPDGCRIEYSPGTEPGFPSHPEKKLHCHYHITLTEQEALFTLWRTPEDIDSLLQEAEDQGVIIAVSLYQEVFSEYAKTAPE